MRQQELKAQIQALAEKKYKDIDTSRAKELVPFMLKYIGSPDPELRDDLVYPAFVQFIYRQRLLSKKELQDILDIVLDEEHMFLGMGENGMDSVFTRAFSVLLLAVLIFTHREDPFIPAPQLDRCKKKLIYFLNEEQDRRGFVSEKGWAHSIAHAADALDELALCEEMGKSDLEEMLPVIYKVVCITDCVYTHGEDERLVTAVVSLIKRELIGENQVIEWIREFAAAAQSVEGFPQRMYLQTNIKNFLQTFYFRLLWEGQVEPYQEVLEDSLRSFNRYAPPQDN